MMTKRPPEIVREAIEGLEDMLVRFDGKRKNYRTAGAIEVFYLQVVLDELGRLQSEAVPFVL